MKASKRLALIMAAVLAIRTGAVFAADGTAEEFDEIALTKTDAPADAAVFFDGEEEESEAQSEELSESQSEPLLEDGEGSGSGDLPGDGIIGDGIIGDDIIADGIIEEAFGEETYAAVEETETEYEVIAEEFLDEDSEEMAGGERAAHSHNGVTFELWNETDKLPSDSGNYYLDKDVEISETWTISDGQDIKLCLHDHTIRYTADTGSVILVEGSGQLCLYDCEKTEHRYKIIDDLAQLDDNGSETFYGGCITGGKGTVRKSTAYGGGIYIPDSGKVTIYGGTILGNQTSNGTFKYGGGICVDGSGKLEIDGGSLIGNKAKNGGGICIAGNLSSSIMKNGAIRRNHGIDCAGGVHVLAGSFTMTGGEITDNTTDSMQGGGVFVNYGNTNMKVSGKPVITGNTGSSGSSNVFLIFSVHLPPQSIIKVDGELTYGAAIGVGVSNAYPYSVYPLTEGFTTGFKNAMPEEDPARFFFSDDPGYLVAKNSNGEAGLKEYAARVTELPSSNKRYADGTEQPLLSTPGQAEGGTLLYAVNNDKSTAPEPDADGTPEAERKWKPFIPEEAEAGSYCVWVKAAGDGEHSDSDAKCVVSRICFPVVFRVEDGAWDDGTKGDKMVDLSRYEDEDLLLKLEDGDIPAVGSRPDADFLEGAWDEVPPTDRAISEAKTFTYRYVEKERISRTVTFRVVNGAWDDGSAAEKKVVLNGHAGDTLRLAANQIPAAGSRPAAGYKAGNWDTVPGAGAAITEDTVFTYTYAQDEKVPDVPVKAAPKFEVKDGFHPSSTGNKLTVTWGSVQDADYYEVYAQYCGGGECIKIRTVSGDKTKTSFSKFLGEEFDQTKCFKMYVAAVRGGKRIAKTRLAHVAGRKHKKYTNIKKVKLPRSSYTMTVGKTKKLKPKAVLENKKKKELPAKEHGTARFKYDSTDTSVATVSKSGKIKAVGKGTCEIWVYALSGASQKVTITVK